jgi:hypothetical protein
VRGKGSCWEEDIRANEGRERMLGLVGKLEECFELFVRKMSGGSFERLHS